MIELTEETFEKEVIGEEKPVLIDFFAEWCGPCKMLSPVIEEIAKEQTNIKVCKVNIDEQPVLAEKYQVMSVPTLIVMDHGVPKEKSVGVQSKEAILQMLA